MIPSLGDTTAPAFLVPIRWVAKESVREADEIKEEIKSLLKDVMLL
jgi:hypothetical protein